MPGRAATKTVSSEKFVLGSKSFAAISAVEGLKLRPASEERLGRTASLSQAQRRALTIRAFAGSRKRG
jgi:hypothetical protein